MRRSTARSARLYRSVHATPAWLSHLAAAACYCAIWAAACYCLVTTLNDMTLRDCRQGIQAACAALRR